jgi:hypothetical protein
MPGMASQPWLFCGFTGCAKTRESRRRRVPPAGQVRIASAGLIIAGSRKPEICPVFCPASRGTSVTTSRGTSVGAPASVGPHAPVYQAQVPQVPPVTVPVGPVAVP